MPTLKDNFKFMLLATYFPLATFPNHLFLKKNPMTNYIRKLNHFVHQLMMPIKFIAFCSIIN